MIIGVDVDGTIIDNGPKFKPVPFALESMKAFIDNGASIVLSTCRMGRALEQIRQYLHQNGITVMVNPIDAQIKRDLPSLHQFGFGVKPFAQLYIDDLAFGCPLIKLEGFHNKVVDWSIVGPEVIRLLKSHQEEKND